MKRYDPDTATDPALWLSLDEGQRILLVEEYHRAARIQAPGAKLHAVAHAVVENQIAEGVESVIRAMARLESEGLSRHDCIHAVGTVLMAHIHRVLTTNDPERVEGMQKAYDAAVDRLTAESWLAQAEE